MGFAPGFFDPCSGPMQRALFEALGTELIVCRAYPGSQTEALREPHIPRKTSEMWGTRVSVHWTRFWN
jgi:hypothetical protein